jgi:hypothetical protein
MRPGLRRRAPACIISVKSVKEAADDDDDDEALHAAAHLMQLSLRPGMAIEVYVRPCFWIARIDSVVADGFWYLFEGNDEMGWCPHGEFLSQWRFPLVVDSTTTTTTTTSDEEDTVRIRRRFTRRTVQRLLLYNYRAAHPHHHDADHDDEDAPAPPQKRTM